ncbi:MAG TPA: hypothetical protein VH087_04925 [Thermoanaerobaculia bacterium]|jgi:hypothetical protein|nr:hypothetical protein [Thermoanaerobaculia bacterium]
MTPRIEVGDTVAVAGDTQDFLLVDPARSYRGKVIGRDGGSLLVELDDPVVRGANRFTRATVPEHRVKRLS